MSRASVEFSGDSVELGLGVGAQVFGARKVLPQKSVRVLVAAALPRTAVCWAASSSGDHVSVGYVTSAERASADP